MNIPHKLHIAQIKILEHLPKEDLSNLYPYFKLENFAQSEIICLKNSPIEKIYFILEGIASINSYQDFSLDNDKRLKYRKDHAYGILWADDIVGLIGLSENCKFHICSYIAIKPVVAVSIEIEHFLKFVKNDKATSFRLVDYAIRKHLEMFNFMNAKVNGIEAQLKYLERVFKSKGFVLSEALSNQEISKIIGSSREIISKYITRKTTNSAS